MFRRLDKKVLSWVLFPFLLSCVIEDFGGVLSTGEGTGEEEGATAIAVTEPTDTSHFRTTVEVTGSDDSITSYYYGLLQGDVECPDRSQSPDEYEGTLELSEKINWKYSTMGDKVLCLVGVGTDYEQATPTRYKWEYAIEPHESGVFPSGLVMSEVTADINSGSKDTFVLVLGNTSSNTISWSTRADHNSKDVQWLFQVKQDGSDVWQSTRQLDGTANKPECRICGELAPSEIQIIRVRMSAIVDRNGISRRKYTNWGEPNVRRLEMMVSDGSSELSVTLRLLIPKIEVSETDGFVWNRQKKSLDTTLGPGTTSRSIQITNVGHRKSKLDWQIFLYKRKKLDWIHFESNGDTLTVSLDEDSDLYPADNAPTLVRLAILSNGDSNGAGNFSVEEAHLWEVGDDGSQTKITSNSDLPWLTTDPKYIRVMFDPDI